MRLTSRHHSTPLIAMLALAATSSAACRGGASAKAAAGAAPAPPSAVKVLVARARKAEISRVVTLPGAVRAFQETMLYAKVAGYLKTITVDRGDRVRAGQLLAQIDVPELQADLAKQKAELTVAGSELERLSEAAGKAPNLVMPQSVDNAKGKYDIAKATLDRTETLLAYAKITAPFAGVVSHRFVDLGAFIPSATSGSVTQNPAIVTITDLSSVRIDVAVPEREVALIETGLPARIVADGVPGRMFAGSVTRLAYALDERSRTMAAEVQIKNPDQLLRPGMYASVQIAIERKPEALVIPLDALVIDKSKTFAFTLVGDKAKRVGVKTGFRDTDKIEILEGIALDQAVLLAARIPLTDGQPVAAVEPQ